MEEIPQVGQWGKKWTWDSVEAFLILISDAAQEDKHHRDIWRILFEKDNRIHEKTHIFKLWNKKFLWPWSSTYDDCYTSCSLIFGRR
jgi:hypothetical protein